MATRSGVLVIVVAALLAALVPLTGSVYLIYLATQLLIFVLFATSLNLLIGFAGLVSFGHAAYFALGGYACAILLRSYDMPLAVAMSGAVLLTGGVAAVIGFFCVRLTSYYFAMLTLAFGQLIWAVAFKWRAVTGGDDGFLRVPAPAWIGTPSSFYLFCVVVVAMGMLAMWVVAQSPLGRTLVAIRENEVRAGFLGVHTRRIQLVAFTLAGVFASVAGALFAMFNGSIFPNSAWWLQSAEVLIMVVLGGMHSFFGPALGAIALILLGRLTLEITAYWPALLAIVLMITLFFFPSGIAGLFGARRGKQ